MENYFNYLREMVLAVLSNFARWLNMRWAVPWAPVPDDFVRYGIIFDNFASGFGFWGWFFFVLFAIFFVAAIGALVFLIYWLLRKYIKFYRTEIDRERLREEVQNLQIELYNATQEKNRILGLQLDSLGISPAESISMGPQSGEASSQEAAGEETEENVTPGEKDVRFPRLIAVDEKYAEISTHVELPADAQDITLQGIVERFRNYAASQLKLYYTIPAMRAFFASMGTGKIIILEGISGTGKTSLPYALGKFFQNNCTICSVQPSWRDRSELLGFYNDFTKKFTETEFLRSIYESTFREDINLIVLDEMNIARIEYYFAEFLSIMEMPNPSAWNIDLISSPQKDDPKHLRDGKLLIPQNVWFIGTANNDDSTFTITDKVYDRAMSLFFDNKGIAFEAEHTQAMPITYEKLHELYEQAKNDYPLSQKTLDKFAELDDFVIRNFKLAFGNRILKQMSNFVPCYVACGGTELQAVDYIFESKILKKFEVLNVAFLRDELLALDKELTNLFGRTEFKKSRKKIQDLLKMNG